MATKTLDLSYSNVYIPFDADGFSDEALAPNGLAYHTQQLCNTLKRVLVRVKRIEDYYRAEADNTTFDGLYGLDEVMASGDTSMGSSLYGSPMTRPRVSASYLKPNYYQYDKVGNVMTKFYKTIYKIMTCFCGMQPNVDFDSANIPSYQKLYAGVSYDYYATAETLMTSVGISIPEYWSPERFKQADLNAHPDIADGSHRVDVMDENSYFHGSYFYYHTGSGYLGSNSSRFVYSLNLFSIIHTIKMSERMWLKMIAYSNSLGDITTSAPSNYLSGIGNIKGGKLVQIRQALSEVAYYVKQNGYDIYNPGTSTNSVSNGRIGKRIKKALSNRGIVFASEEIADYTKDPTNFSYSDNYKLDPLMIAAAGFANMKTTPSSTNYSTALVPAVHLCRRYVSRRQYVPYDYKEADSASAFEQASGKVSYLKSNVRVWLNSRGSYYGTTGSYAWSKKTHDNDAFYTTSSGRAYLSSLSDTLLANIANTTMCYLSGENLAEVKSTHGGVNRLAEQYAFLPTLTMFGIENKSTVRNWTNYYIGIDCANYTDTSDGNTYVGGCAESELNGEYVCYEEVEEAKDLVENAWELGNRALQFVPNPNFTGDTTTYEKLHIPTSTPAYYTADTKDTTIPNRIATFYLSKADGTSTSISNGATTPYTYNPCAYAFALVPFKSNALCGVYQGYAAGPELRMYYNNYE